MTATTTTRERQVEVRKQPAAQKHEWRQVKGREMNKKKTKEQKWHCRPMEGLRAAGGRVLVGGWTALVPPSGVPPPKIANPSPGNSMGPEG